MPILRLIAKIRNVLSFRTAKATNQVKFTCVELQELAERADFDRILDAAGVLNSPVAESVPKKWSEGKEFDAFKFDDATYKEYEANSLTK
jgi:hypothetical protein